MKLEKKLAQASVIMPKELLSCIKQKAKENDRSLSSEISHSLKKMYLDLVEDIK